MAERGRDRDRRAGRQLDHCGPRNRQPADPDDFMERRAHRRLPGYHRPQQAAILLAAMHIAGHPTRRPRTPCLVEGDPPRTLSSPKHSCRRDGVSLLSIDPHLETRRGQRHSNRIIQRREGVLGSGLVERHRRSARICGSLAGGTRNLPPLNRRGRLARSTGRPARRGSVHPDTFPR